MIRLSVPIGSHICHRVDRRECVHRSPLQRWPCYRKPSSKAVTIRTRDLKCHNGSACEAAVLYKSGRVRSSGERLGLEIAAFPQSPDTTHWIPTFTNPCSVDFWAISDVHSDGIVLCGRGSGRKWTGSRSSDHVKVRLFMLVYIAEVKFKAQGLLDYMKTVQH